MRALVGTFTHNVDALVGRLLALLLAYRRGFYRDFGLLHFGSRWLKFGAVSLVRHRVFLFIHPAIKYLLYVVLRAQDS